MPVLLCNLASVFLGSREEEPFRAALGDQPEPGVCSLASRIRHPIELVDGAYADFQTGRIGESEYARHLRSRLGWTGTDPQLVGLFVEAPEVFYLGALEVIRDLRARGWTLVGLENANPWQRRTRLRVYTDLMIGPDRLITSLDAGARLPDPKAFAYAQTCLGRRSGQLLYVDRDPGNIAAARNAGVQAHLLRGSRELAAAAHDLVQDHNLVPDLARDLADDALPAEAGEG